MQSTPTWEPSGGEQEETKSPYCPEFPRPSQKSMADHCRIQIHFTSQRLLDSNLRSGPADHNSNAPKQSCGIRSADTEGADWHLSPSMATSPAQLPLPQDGWKEVDPYRWGFSHCETHTGESAVSCDLKRIKGRKASS